MKRLSLPVLWLWLCLLTATVLHADAAASGEDVRIEALIAHVAGMEGARFIRNGKEYDPGSAAKFLRGKWKANRKEIHSAPDFIAKAATYSGTTGKAYEIRLKDGTTTPCAAYLTAQLAKMAPARAGAK